VNSVAKKKGKYFRGNSSYAVKGQKKNNLENDFINCISNKNCQEVYKIAKEFGKFLSPFRSCIPQQVIGSIPIRHSL
ncbi:MAG: hypothetical protein VYB59_03775, partial [Pseudomonadota bacterium]|nr:hypothetical protein [Pseudomonadota bacterium]